MSGNDPVSSIGVEAFGYRQELKRTLSNRTARNHMVCAPLQREHTEMSVVHQRPRGCVSRRLFGGVFLGYLYLTEIRNSMNRRCFLRD
jgi:hypothetical protein